MSDNVGKGKRWISLALYQGGVGEGCTALSSQANKEIERDS